MTITAAAALSVAPAIASGDEANAQEDQALRTSIQETIEVFFNALQASKADEALDRIKERFPIDEETRGKLAPEMDRLKKTHGGIESWRCIGWIEPAVPGRIGRVVYLSFHDVSAVLWQFDAYQGKKAVYLTHLKFNTEDVLDKLTSMGMIARAGPAPMVPEGETGGR